MLFLLFFILAILFAPIIWAIHILIEDASEPKDYSYLNNKEYRQLERMTGGDFFENPGMPHSYNSNSGDIIEESYNSNGSFSDEWNSTRFDRDLDRGEYDDDPEILREEDPDRYEDLYGNEEFN